MYPINCMWYSPKDEGSLTLLY